jgi:hypothetical protein
MWTKTKTAIAALAVGMGLAALATPAAAKTILVFAQNHVTPPGFVVINDNGNGTTSLVTDIPVTITDIDGPLVPPPITDAIFTLSALSTNFSTTFTAGGITFLVQRYTGSFTVTAPECGTNCLSGSFVDLISGPVGGRALTLAATTPPASALTFTSTTIPAGDLLLDRGLALADTALVVPLSQDCTSPIGCTLATNSANVSGTFSAGGTIPEPSTWVMMVLGFAGLGFAGYRSSRSKMALVD